jgi:hypothetical protein
MYLMGLQEKPKFVVQLLGKNLKRSLLSNRVNHGNIHERPIAFLRTYIIRNIDSWDKKGKKEGEMKEGYQIPKILCEGTRLINYSMERCSTFHEKEWLRW